MQKRKKSMSSCSYASLNSKIAIKLGVEEATAFAGLETELRGSKCSFFRLFRHEKWCKDSGIGILGMKPIDLSWNEVHRSSLGCRQPKISNFVFGYREGKPLI
jgi:hypothetical protein